jgi:hypothetical protein
MNDIFHSTEIQERFDLFGADLPEADTNKYSGKRPLVIFIPPRTDRKYLIVTNGARPMRSSLASELLAQLRQVTNVQLMENVYSATSNDESDSKENSDEKITVGLLIVIKDRYRGLVLIRCQNALAVSP